MLRTNGTETLVLLPDNSNNNTPTCYSCQPTVFMPDGTSIKAGQGGTADPCLLSGSRMYCY